MIKNIVNTVIEGKHSKPILLDVFLKENQTKKPVVIFVHGFKGFKDWGHFNETAYRFANEDFVFVKFNFSHNGHTLNNPDECTDEEVFGRNNFTIEMDDLGAVIDWIVSSEELHNQVDVSKIYLIGHSRGGGISILKTAEDNRIKKLITWASVCDFGDRYNDNQIAVWKEKGKLEVVNGRTGQVLPLYYQLYEDYHKNINRLSIPLAAKKINVPFLIIHGTADEAVDFVDAIRLDNWCKSSTLIEISNSGHTFEAKHPFNKKDKYPENLENVIQYSINFLKD